MGKNRPYITFDKHLYWSSQNGVDLYKILHQLGRINNANAHDIAHIDIKKWGRIDSIFDSLTGKLKQYVTWAEK